MRIGSIFIALGILIASLFSSCTTSIKRSNEEFIDKDIEVDNFNRIKLEGAYNVTIEQGAKPGLKINAPENLQKNLKAYTENNLLRISTEIKNLTPEEIRLYITVDSLEEIDLEGGILLNSIGTLKVSSLTLIMKGGASINLDVDTETLFSRTEGGANMEFTGKTNKFTAISEGAGNIEADKLEAKTVTCRVAGVGNASVYATENLDATVEGLGKISYRGNPSVNKKVNGIGVIYRK
jgi:hypothetical protein